MSSELLLVHLDQNKCQKHERSIKRPTSYENLRQFIIENFGINIFDMYYFDQTNKEVYITNNEKFKNSGGLIFIIEKKTLDQSLYSAIQPSLSQSKVDVIDDKCICVVCLEKPKEDPYCCKQCSKIICKNYLIKMNKKKSTEKPLECPYCRNELPFEKWLILKNFNEQTQTYLELIGENLKIRCENNIYTKKENEFLKQNQILRAQLKEANENIEKKNKEMEEKTKKFHETLKNNIQKKNKDFKDKEAELNKLLDEKEAELNKLKEENNKLFKQVEKLNDDLNKLKDLTPAIIDDYFIYDVEKDHIDEEGYVYILGENFVKNNKGTLIINNDKLDHLVSKYKLKIGTNKIKINLDKNQIIDISYMFCGCKSLTGISPLKEWDVSNGNNFSNMFCICKSLKDISPLKEWDVSNGNNFSSMFCDCESLIDLSPLGNWNVKNGSNFSSMFSFCESLNDLSPLKNWNVSNGNNFSIMFNDCISLNDITPLKDWNVSNGNNYVGMFRGVENISEEVINNYKQLNPKFKLI